MPWFRKIYQVQSSFSQINFCDRQANRICGNDWFVLEHRKWASLVALKQPVRGYAFMFLNAKTANFSQKSSKYPMHTAHDLLPFFQVSIQKSRRLFHSFFTVAAFAFPAGKQCFRCLCIENGQKDHGFLLFSTPCVILFETPLKKPGFSPWGAEFQR